MQLFIDYDDGERSRAAGPFFSIEDAETEFNRITSRPKTFSARCWNTDPRGSAVGKPVMSFERQD